MSKAFVKRAVWMEGPLLKTPRSTYQEDYRGVRKKPKSPWLSKPFAFPDLEKRVHYLLTESKKKRPDNAKTSTADLVNTVPQASYAAQHGASNKEHVSARIRDDKPYPVPVRSSGVPQEALQKIRGHTETKQETTNKPSEPVKKVKKRPPPAPALPVDLDDDDDSLDKEEELPDELQEAEEGGAEEELEQPEDIEVDEKMKEQMQNQIRKAVHEYLDHLRESNQWHPEDGPPISAHDIMVSAKSLGIKTSAPVAAEIMDDYIPDEKRTQQPYKDYQTGKTEYAPAMPQRSKSVPPPPRSKTPRPPSEPVKKSDYHWMVWRTTPTPTPKTPVPPKTPNRNTKTPVPAWRPQTPASPKNPPTIAELQGADPVSLRNPTAEPFCTPTMRYTHYVPAPPTPAPPSRPHAPTPPELRADYRDNMTQDQVEPMPDNIYKTPGVPTVEPALASWFRKATPEERQMAYSMFKAIGTDRTTGQSVSASMPARAASATSRTPAATPLYPDDGNAFTRDLARSLEHYYKIPSKNGMRREKYPTARHITRRRPQKDYTHETSFFMNAQKPFRSHYIIHEDWVSEHQGIKKNLSQMKTGPNGLRYGSK